MANDVEGLVQLATVSFRDNLQLNLQQQVSRLRGKVSEGSYVGKQAQVVDYMAPFAMRAPASRFAELNRVDPQFSRRWITPQDRDLPIIIDSFDKLRTLEDPTSAINTGAAAAAARQWDDFVIAAAFGTAQTSTADGTTLVSETFAQAQTNLTGSSTGLTIADTFGNGATSIGLTTDKLIEARRLFKHYHVTDPEMAPGMLTLVIGSWQEAEMLKLIEVTSSEFTGKYVLNDGRLDGGQFLGWNIVVSERLNVASNIRDCIAFVQSGLHLGIWMDMRVSIDKLVNISGQPYQVYTQLTANATRLEPGRVIKIRCGGDTSGGDNI